MVGAAARKALAVALLALIAGIGVLGSNPASASEPICPNPDTPSAAMTMPDFESSVLCLINQQRATYHLKPLRPNGLLHDAAWIYVTSQLAGDFFGHHGSLTGRNDASTVIGRLKFLNYIPPGRRWIVGEILREAQPDTSTPAGVVNAYMVSPPHRQRILKAKFEDIGVAAAPGVANDFPSTEGVTVAVEFGFRRN
jgi:uncharacterized protein YkwD